MNLILPPVLKQFLIPSQGHGVCWILVEFRPIYIIIIVIGSIIFYLFSTRCLYFPVQQ